MKKLTKNQKGSLALEQVLFIGAVVTMSIGLFAFYDNISSYFKNFNISNLPTSATVPSTNTSGS